MSLRNKMREFYRLVHPDLSGGLPYEAAVTNSSSLMELNSYVDRLSSSTINDGPFVARNIQFFTPVIKKDGTSVPSSIKPFSVVLHSVPPDADMIERRALSESLLEQLKSATTYTPMISNQNKEQRHIDDIISTSRNSTATQSLQSRLAKIWYDEHENYQINKSIYGNNSSDEVSLREYRTMLAHNKLVSKYSRISNVRKRLEKLSKIESIVSSNVAEIPTIDLDQSDSGTDEKKLSLIESGFHPDLVFFRSSLTLDQQRIGLCNICGEFLTSEEEIWLLENVWEAMRTARKPSVPLVLSPNTWKASKEGGYIEVPFDFKLQELVDFLEDHLESIRQARKDLLDNFTAV